MSKSNNYVPKQLSMLIEQEAISELPEVSLSSGYILRGYNSGDEASWIDLLNQDVDWDRWDREKFDSYMDGPERKSGSYVVEKDGSILAATFASRSVEPPNTGRVDFVISHPDHRGNGTGRAVCTAVLQYLMLQRYDSVILFTDDWRLEAIGLYLSLGFEPQMTRDDMPERWSTVMEKLGK